MPRHVVVDGSNLATEGRAMPSLKQLNEAVMAWLAENSGDLVTVVVDATFGHRIDAKEVSEFDAAVENNEIVAPPAGAIGRGDAFVLAIADKVKATVLSNDSYQEFHGQYEWLFDEGRLIGGKPVPHIGWVFVPRVPVRGPLSRKAVRAAQRRNGEEGRGKRASKEASQPMPVPKAPPPGAVVREGRGRRGRGEPVAEPVGVLAPEVEPVAPPLPAEPAGKGHHLNDLLLFLGFVEQHPVGTTLSAIVESYSSHGAYVKIGDVSGYVPLRLMADPPPRSARTLMSVGDAVTLVVAGFNPGRRGIDLGLPGMVPVAPPAPAAKAAKGRGAKKAARPEAPVEVAEEVVAAVEVASEEAGLSVAPLTVEEPAAAKRARRGHRHRAGAATPAPAAEAALPAPVEALTEAVPTERPPVQGAPAAKRAKAAKAATATTPAKRTASPKPAKAASRDELGPPGKPAAAAEGPPTGTAAKARRTAKAPKDAGSPPAPAKPAKSAKSAKATTSRRAANAARPEEAPTVSAPAEPAPATTSARMRARADSRASAVADTTTAGTPTHSRRRHRGGS